MSQYEKIKYTDPNFPLTFHDQVLTENRTVGFYAHWHEHIEILCITNGNAFITINNITYEINEGDTVVIDSNALHSMLGKPNNCLYHCLIVDKQFCDSFFLPITGFRFEALLHDERIYNIFLRIAAEMQEKSLYYKAQVQAYALELMVILLREYSESYKSKKAGGASADYEKPMQKLVKEAISYISSSFYNPLTVDEIAEHVGISKYYFCRGFKEMTGQTVFDYINLLRCSNAQKLLRSGRYNISESAFASGFNNLSYFAKSYRKYMGVLPSKDIK